MIRDADEERKDAVVATKAVRVVAEIRAVGVHAATRPLRRKRAREEDMEADNNNNNNNNNNSSNNQIVPQPRRSKRLLASIAEGPSTNQRTATTDPVDQVDLPAKPLAVRPSLEEGLSPRTWTAKQQT